MSGIYIPGMEMPASCGYCPLKYRTMEGDECMFDAAYTTYQSRPKDCPLIPVPPHGRLIDADAVTLEDGPYEYDDWCKWALEQYQNAPTIIPASKGGKT